MKPCPALWETPVINWNGDVTVCYNDLLFKLKLGNINRKTLKQIMNSDKMKEIRIKHILGETSEIPVCKYCPGISLNDKKQFYKKLTFWLIENKRTDLIKDLNKWFNEDERS